MLHKVATFSCVLLLVGCSNLGGLGRDRAQTQVAAPSGEALQAAQLAAYMAELQKLIQGSPAEQAEALTAAKLGYEQQRQGPAVLRYGLALAAPRHPGRDAAQAQRLLREALARPELLSVTERALAVVELQRVDAELRLLVENQRLVTEAQRERERNRNNASSAALARRLQTEMDESARLRKALDEARAKLDAIATIEQNISDRAPAKEGRTP
jgi:hypothetical protein